jgi:hypothetical protein
MLEPVQVKLAALVIWWQLAADGWMTDTTMPKRDMRSSSLLS